MTYAPPPGAVFRTRPIGPGPRLAIGAVVRLVPWAEEGRKLVVRWQRR